MWIPKSEDEIASVVAAGSLEETATFDAKESLTKKSKEVAKDIAAMANDGGVLLYGVGEDEHGAPARLTPIPLAGERERLSSIIQTCIAEPPTVTVQAIPTSSDPTVGYLVVAVTASPRAPHMVIVDRDNRYYGRTATGNTPLGEGEVARLYERRKRWERSVDDLLTDLIGAAPLPVNEDHAYIHLACWTVLADDELLTRARRATEVRAYLRDLIQSSQQASIFPQSYAPDFTAPTSWRREPDGWTCYIGSNPQYEPERKPTRVLDVYFGDNGNATLFCGRAAERRDGTLIVFEEIVAGLTTRLLWILGNISERGGYLGPVDIALAVTGLKGGISYLATRQFAGHQHPPYERDQYRRTTRALASSFATDPRGIAKKLVIPLAQATTQANNIAYPFSQEGTASQR